MKSWNSSEKKYICEVSSTQATRANEVFATPTESAWWMDESNSGAKLIDWAHTSFGVEIRTNHFGTIHMVRKSSCPVVRIVGDKWQSLAHFYEIAKNRKQFHILLFLRNRINWCQRQQVCACTTQVTDTIDSYNNNNNKWWVTIIKCILTKEQANRSDVHLLPIRTWRYWRHCESVRYKYLHSTCTEHTHDHTVWAAHTNFDEHRGAFG